MKNLVVLFVIGICFFSCISNNSNNKAITVEAEIDFSYPAPSDTTYYFYQEQEYLTIKTDSGLWATNSHDEYVFYPKDDLITMDAKWIVMIPGSGEKMYPAQVIPCSGNDLKSPYLCKSILKYEYCQCGHNKIKAPELEIVVAQNYGYLLNKYVPLSKWNNCLITSTH